MFEQACSLCISGSGGVVCSGGHVSVGQSSRHPCQFRSSRAAAVCSLTSVLRRHLASSALELSLECCLHAFKNLRVSEQKLTSVVPQIT